MGYCVEVRGRVKIAKENKDRLFEIFKELDQSSWRWVSKGFSQLKTVKGVFEELGYEAKLTKKGYYVITERIWEKIGDDADIWRRLAPVVMDGSYLKCAGEDHAHWKWTFKDGKLEEKWGKVTYE